MTKSARQYFTILFLLGAIVLWGLSALTNGPKPKSMNAPASEFSAQRAFVELEDLIGNNLPHPSGSAENLRIRKSIEQKFTALGYTPEIQKDLGCTLHYPGCTEVENIVVRLKGTNQNNNNALMLTAHYDSVPAGPAAADDGAGTVAMLEIARILKTIPSFKNDIIFLITDGEEGGLRGAQAFVDRGTMIKDVKLVVNLESRGVSGASTLFETSDGNYPLIKGYAQRTTRPAAASVSYEVYSRLPNDTDYSIYKKEGIMGLNYAFSGDVALYHSVHDTVDNLNKTSLQHHGDNMLAAVHAFGDADLSALQGTSNATYIDIFGRFLLYWPASLNMWFAIISLLAFMGAVIARRPKISTFVWSSGALIALVLITPALGWLLSFPLGHWPDLFYLDHPYPWPGRLALISAAILATWIVSRIFKTKVSFNALILNALLIFSLIGLLTSFKVAGASYMFLIPTLAMTVGIIIDLLSKHENLIVTAHIGIIVMFYMAFYHFIPLELIAHYKLSAIRIVPLLLLTACLLPVFIRKDKPTSNTFGWGLGISMVVFTAVSAFLPGFNLKHPRMQNLVYVQGYEDGKAIWISETSGKQDKQFLKDSEFTNTPVPHHLYDILWGKTVAKETATGKFNPPRLTLHGDTVKDNIRTITMDVQSSHGGYAMNIGFKKNATPYTVRVNNQLAADYRANPYKRPIAIRGGKKNTYTITIKTPADRPLDLALVDSFSLKPHQLEGMDAHRPDISAPLHSGDRAHIFKPLTIGCGDHCKAEN